MMKNSNFSKISWSPSWLQKSRRVFLTLSLVIFLGSALRVHASGLHQQPDLGSAPTDNLSLSPHIVSRYADVVADCAGNTHVIWVEQDDGDDANRTCSITHTMWDGVSWTSPNSIAIDRQVLIPIVESDSLGNLYVVYLSWSDIFLIRTQGGLPELPSSWSTPLKVDQHGADEMAHWFTFLIDDRDRLHILYQVATDPLQGETVYRSELYYSGSQDGGDTWTDPVRISTLGELAGFTGQSNSLTVDHKGNVYAIWGEGQVSAAAYTKKRMMFASSLDGGQTWSAPLVLGTSSPGAFYNEPIALLNVYDDKTETDVLHAIWLRGQNEVVHQRSLDHGRSWATPETVFVGGGDVTRYGKGSAVVDGEGRIHLVMPMDTQDLYYAVWENGAWTSPVNITNDPLRCSYWPRLALDGWGYLHLVWNQGYPELAIPDRDQRLLRGEYEILHRRVFLSGDAAMQRSCSPITTTVPTATVLPAAESSNLTSESSPTPTLNPNAPPVGNDSPMLPLFIGGIAALGILVLAIVARLGRR